MRLKLTIWLLMTIFVAAQARQIDENQAREIARSFLSTKVSNSGSPRFIQKSNGICKARPERSRSAATDDPSFYVFSLQNADNGFVIVAADDRVKPIIGWSGADRFDAEEMPPQLVAYLHQYDSLYAEMQAGNTKLATTLGGAAVEPLITTQWNQEEPYDMFTPVYSDGTHAPTGCVATAMAQVMNYHKYPAKGYGSIEGWYYDERNVNLEESRYDWANMRNTYRQGEYTEQEGEAVARLMYDVGRAVDMMYDKYQSGAYDARIPGALYRHFNYDGDAKCKFREYFTSQSWIDMIRESLLRNEPLIYGGVGQAGHEFVCDGIDSDDYLHINWGWGGSCDGYFDLNAFAPASPGTGGGDGNYYRQHTIILNVRPGDPNADHSDFIRPPMIFESRWYNRSVDIKIYNTNNTDYQSEAIGIIVDLYDQDKKLVKESIFKCAPRTRINKNSIINASIEWYNSNSPELSDVPDGEYYVSYRYAADKERPFGYGPPSWDNKEKLYIASFGYAGEEFFPLTVQNGAVVASDYTGDDLSKTLIVEKIEQTGPIYDVDESPIVYVNFRNEGTSYISKETLSVYCVPESEWSADMDLLKVNNSQDCNFYDIYMGTSRALPLWLSFDGGMAAGRYKVILAKRTYDSAGNIIVTPLVAETDCVIEISPVPDADAPFVMLTRLETKYSQQDNGIGQYMELSWKYKPNEGWESWFEYDSRYLQLWACNKATPDRPFLMYEGQPKMPYNIYWGNTAEFICYPELKWKEAGEYRMWLKYQHNGEWVDVPGENNTCDFTIVDTQPTGPYLMLDAPAVINDGRPVVIDQEFNVKLRFISPSGINLNENSVFVSISETLGDNWSDSAISDWFPIADKWTLAAGETCEITVKFNISQEWADYKGIDLNSYIGKELFVNPYLCFLEDGSSWQADLIYNDFIKSLAFTVHDPAGIEEITVDTDDDIDFSQPYDVYNLQGQRVGGDVMQLSPGFYILRQGNVSAKHIVQ